MASPAQERSLLRTIGLLLMLIMVAVGAGVCLRGPSQPDPNAGAEIPSSIEHPVDLNLGDMGRQGLFNFFAMAEASVDGRAYEFGADVAGSEGTYGQVGNCSYTSPFTDPGWEAGDTLTGIFRPENARGTPRLEFTDDGLGTIIGMVAVGQREWLFTQRGRAAVELTFAADYRLYRDETGTWKVRRTATGEVADGVVFLLEARWQGEATDNFTSDVAPVRVTIECGFVSRVLKEYLADDELRDVIGVGSNAGA